MRLSVVIRNVLATVALATALASCTVKDWTDERSRLKAAVTFHFVQKDTASVHLFLYGSDGMRYADTIVSSDVAADPAGVFMTYLRDGDYTAIAWNNISEVNVVDSNSMAASYVAAVKEGSYYRPYGDLGYNRTDFHIVKGQRKDMQTEFTSSVERMTVTIRGLKYIAHPEDLYFEFSYLNALGFDNKALMETRMMHYVTYRPTLERYPNELSGTFHSIYTELSPDFPICLASRSAGVIFRRNIGSLLTDDRDVVINIVFDFSPTTFTCTIGDWTETVERVTIDTWDD